MSTDRHIGSTDSVPEAWVPHSEDSLPETWAPELQCHRVGGNAWSLFPERFMGASSEYEPHGQTVRRPRASHSNTGGFGTKAALSHGRLQHGHLPETTSGGDGSYFGKDWDRRVIGRGRIRDPADCRSGPQVPGSFPSECGTVCGDTSDGRRLLGHEETIPLPGDDGTVPTAQHVPTRQSKRHRSGSWSDQQLATTVATVDAGCQLATTAETSAFHQRPCKTTSTGGH